MSCGLQRALNTVPAGERAVDTQHHLIVAHEVANIGNDRRQLSTMAKQAQEATGVRELMAMPTRVRDVEQWSVRTG